jgi:hypothetical protein
MPGLSAASSTGNPSDALIVAVSGRVKVVVHSADGGELTLTVIRPGSRRSLARGPADPLGDSRRHPRGLPLMVADDDYSGVTAEFNKNVTRLRSVYAQTVHLPGIGLTVNFGAGEEMRTEVSAKFRPAGVQGELAAAGFTMRSWWTDAAGQFGLSLSVPTR